MTDVIVEHLQAHALERRHCRSDLGQDVDAVPVLLDHPLDPTHLPLDAPQPLADRLLVVAVRHARTLRKRRSRSELVTTKRLENGHRSRPRRSGSGSPATASGIAATLYANAQNRLPLIVASDAPREPDRVDGRPQVARDEREVGRLDRHVRARADREPEVGLRERRRVVDAVADHRDDLTGVLQAPHLRHLVRRQHLGDDPLDADLVGDPPCGRSASPVSSTGVEPE